MSANSRSARSWSPSASSAITSSQVSAPVTHGLVSTQRTPEAGHHEVVPAAVDQLAPRLAADGAAEHRVVPVHREGRLVQEQVAVVAQRVPEPARRRAPTRAAGRRSSSASVSAGAQRVVDARRAGQQAVAVDPGRARRRPLLRPGDAAEGQLQRARRSRGRGAPSARCVRDERRVAAYQPVVPDADRDVGRHVGLAAGVLDHARPPIFIGQEPSRRWVRRTQAQARSAASYRPATSSAIAASTWFQTSVWPPTVHGIAPSRLLHGRDRRAGSRHLRRA